MPVVLVAAVAVSAAATAYGAYEQKQSADNAAQVDTATAAYNARYDESLAAQLDEDTQANIATARKDDAVYISREAASYASAGVLATTGSALHAQITNAGHFEKEIQQKWVNANQQEQSYQSQAIAGVAYGAAQASADRMSGNIALINGGAKIASTIGSAYEGGAFSFGGGGSPQGMDSEQLATTFVAS